MLSMAFLTVGCLDLDLSMLSLVGPRNVFGALCPLRCLLVSIDLSLGSEYARYPGYIHVWNAIPSPVSSLGPRCVCKLIFFLLLRNCLHLKGIPLFSATADW